jgi:hypothetical protein
MVAACANPASLAGGSGPLHAYLGTHGSGIVGGVEAEPGPWVTPPQVIDTPFVSVPGMLTSECVSNENGSYLAVTVHSDPSGPRAKDIVGDVIVGGKVQADWGLHLIDANLAMGNLIEIVAQEAKAYASTTAKK